MSKLCDAYGKLLTERMLGIIRSYYDYDLSLAEIAENFGITRQAALDAIKQAEIKLIDYESKLGLVEKSDKLTRSLERLRSEMDVNIEQAKATVRSIIDETN